MSITETLATKSQLFLVIPALEERCTLEDTIKSVSPHAEIFNRIVISVNGKNSSKIGCIASQHLGKHAKPEIYCTGAKLSAMRHMAFICSKLKPYKSSNTYVYLLADDDLMPAAIDPTEYTSITTDPKALAVGLGNFLTFTDNAKDCHDEPQRIGAGETLTPLEFLERNQSQGFAFTSISSMIIPCGALINCIKFMAFLGSSGRRAEYIFAAHKDVTKLYRPINASALIRTHANQEGRILSYLSCVHDEIIYLLWVWINQPATRPWRSKSHLYGQTYKRLRFLIREFIREGLKSRHPEIHNAVKAWIGGYRAQKLSLKSLFVRRHKIYKDRGTKY